MMLSGFVVGMPGVRSRQIERKLRVSNLCGQHLRIFNNRVIVGHDRGVHHLCAAKQTICEDRSLVLGVADERPPSF